MHRQLAVVPNTPDLAVKVPSSAGAAVCESDLDIGGKTIVEAIHIPMPTKGMYVWGHKVSSDSEHRLVLIQSKETCSLAVEMDLGGGHRMTFSR